MSEDPPVRSVARAVDVLLSLTDGPRTLGDVAAAAELSKATGHRILASLTHRQLVVQDPGNGMYMLGPGCLGIVDAVTRGSGGLHVAAQPVLERLRDETGETITVHVRVGNQRVCVHELPSRQAVRYTAGVGHTAPVYLGSAGKVLLAFLDEQLRSEILEASRLQAVTERTITDRSALERELGQVRSRGYAQSRGERVPGAAAISVPIDGHDGDVVAALSILGPDSRLPTATLKELHPRLEEAAATISTRIGGGAREVRRKGSSG